MQAKKPKITKRERQHKAREIRRKKLPEVGERVVVKTKYGSQRLCIYRKGRFFLPYSYEYSFSQHEILSWRRREQMKKKILKDAKKGDIILVKDDEGRYQLRIVRSVEKIKGKTIFNGKTVYNVAPPGVDYSGEEIVDEQIGFEYDWSYEYLYDIIGVFTEESNGMNLFDQREKEC